MGRTRLESTLNSNQIKGPALGTATKKPSNIQKKVRKQRRKPDAFWMHSGSVLGGLWDHFGNQKAIKMRLKFWMRCSSPKRLPKGCKGRTTSVLGRLLGRLWAPVGPSVGACWSVGWCVGGSIARVRGCPGGSVRLGHLEVPLFLGVLGAQQAPCSSILLDGIPGTCLWANVKGLLAPFREPKRVPKRVKNRSQNQCDC